MRCGDFSSNCGMNEFLPAVFRGMPWATTIHQLHIAPNLIQGGPSLHTISANPPPLTTLLPSCRLHKVNIRVSSESLIETAPPTKEPFITLHAYNWVHISPSLPTPFLPYPPTPHMASNLLPHRQRESSFLPTQPSNPKIQAPASIPAYAPVSRPEHSQP